MKQRVVAAIHRDSLGAIINKMEIRDLGRPTSPNQAKICLISIRTNEIFVARASIGRD